jgi:phage tail sheath protein FI
VIDAGQLVVEIGLAPSKPAEFVIFRIGQMASGGGVEE